MLSMLLAAPLALAADGTFVLTSSPEETRAKVDAAVEASAATFPGFVRGLVRRRLEPLASVCTTYVWRVDDAQVAWTCDDRVAIVVPRDQLGTTFTLDLGDRTVPTTVTREGSRITARFDGDNGARTNVFTLDEAAGTLHLAVAVTSDRLEVPLAWELSYRRQETATPGE